MDKILFWLKKGWDFPYLVFFFLLALPVFSFYFLYKAYDKLSSLSLLEKKVHTICKRTSVFRKTEKQEEEMLKRIKQPDLHYLTKYKQEFAASSDGDKNLFSEKERKLSKGIIEVELFQKSPIELGNNGLLLLLSKVEGIPVEPSSPLSSRAPIFFKSFEFSRKLLSPDQEVFAVQMQLTYYKRSD